MGGIQLQTTSRPSRPQMSLVRLHFSLPHNTQAGAAKNRLYIEIRLRRDNGRPAVTGWGGVLGGAVFDLAESKGQSFLSTVSGSKISAGWGLELCSDSVHQTRAMTRKQAPWQARILKNINAVPRSFCLAYLVRLTDIPDLQILGNVVFA